MCPGCVAYISRPPSYFLARMTGKRSSELSMTNILAKPHILSLRINQTSLRSAKVFHYCKQIKVLPDLPKYSIFANKSKFSQICQSIPFLQTNQSSLRSTKVFHFCKHIKVFPDLPKYGTPPPPPNPPNSPSLGTSGPCLRLQRLKSLV